jgi:hypothetical protein
MHPNSDSSRGQLTLLVVLTLALAAWGIYHAVGAYFGGFGEENLAHDFRRSLVVLACMGGFLGIWWCLVLTRKPRKKLGK